MEVLPPARLDSFHHSQMLPAVPSDVVVALWAVMKMVFGVHLVLVVVVLGAALAVELVELSSALVEVVAVRTLVVELLAAIVEVVALGVIVVELFSVLVKVVRTLVSALVEFFSAVLLRVVVDVVVRFLVEVVVVLVFLLLMVSSKLAAVLNIVVVFLRGTVLVLSLDIVVVVFFRGTVVVLSQEVAGFLAVLVLVALGKVLLVEIFL